MRKFSLQSLIFPKMGHSLVASVFVFLALFGSWYPDNTVHAIPQNKVIPKVLGVETVNAAAGGNYIALPQKPVEKAALSTDTVYADSFVVYDEKTGEVLVQKNSEEQMPIASLTKLLTGITAYVHLNMNVPIVITAYNKNIPRPVLNLQPGDSVKPLDLIEAMLVGSANDAGFALADAVERLTGKSFPDLMNEQAFKLNMNQSHFSNPVGFDSQYNYSTASDIAKLIKAMQGLEVFSLQGRSTKYSFTSENGSMYRVNATNKLLAKHPDISAIKTGYTNEAAGAMAVKVENKGNSFVIIVLRSGDREGDVLKLKNIIEQSFSWDLR